MPVTDDDLIRAMFSEDKAIARAAKELYDRLHAADPQPRRWPPEPAHCDECFEGCPKCQM